jgi:sugar phosphate isomerase/epimerase
MGQQIATRTYEDAVAWLKDHGFDILEAPGVQNRVFVKKNNCSAAIEATADGGVKIFAYPGFLIGGEIAKLINKGYQQFLKTTKTEVAATADHLKALHQFTEELKEALGATSLYNESLGTVSEEYNYDRVKDRQESTMDRPKRPWEAKSAAKKATRAKQRA